MSPPRHGSDRPRAFHPRIESLEDRRVPATFSVINTADAGRGSLRQAILNANAHPNDQGARDLIRFAIPGSGVHRIPFASDLEITDPVIVDGYTQPGARPNTLSKGDDAVLKIELCADPIIIDGRAHNSRSIVLSGGYSTIRGLVVNNSGDIIISGRGRNVIEGNYLGTDVTGTSVVGGGGGVVIRGSDDNVLGGARPGSRNLISPGPRTFDWYHNGEVPYTEYIDYVSNPVRVTPLLSPVNGSTLRGTSRNRILGNYIGVDHTGGAIPREASELPSGKGMIELFEVSQTEIGGTAVGAGNIIAGRGGRGIYIWSNSNDNRVQGNSIGTVGALDYGIVLHDTMRDLIGGTAPGAGNIITGTRSGGILVSREPQDNHEPLPGISRSIAILSNSIYGNGGLGIELTERGRTPGGVKRPTPNDPGDLDSGGNDLQNFPVLTSARSTGRTTIIRGTLNSTPNSQFTIQVFGNLAGDPSGYGEGRGLIGSFRVLTNARGNTSFAKTYATQPWSRVGRVLSATATDAHGNTSEFSRWVRVQAVTTSRAATSVTQAAGTPNRAATSAAGWLVLPPAADDSGGIAAVSARPRTRGRKG